MKRYHTLPPIAQFLVLILAHNPAATAGTLEGTVAIDAPYNEVAKNERFDGLMTITNIGTELIPYTGMKSGATISPGQAVYKWFNKSEGLRIPLGKDEIGMPMKWNRFESLALSMIPAGGSAYFRIYDMPGRASFCDSMVAHVIVGRDTFLSSNVVELPVTSTVDPAALPTISALKWSNGWTELVKRAVIGKDEFLFTVTEMPEHSRAQRVARIPPGCDVSISHDPVVGSHPDGILLKMTVSFTGGKYEDLVYNAGRYHILSGHPDTVPNAFVRLSKEEATKEDAWKCLEENSRKPWLKCFGKNPSNGIPASVGGKPSQTGNAPPSGESAPRSTQAPNENTTLPHPTGTIRIWLAWGAAVLGAVAGGWMLVTFLRTRGRREVRDSQRH